MSGSDWNLERERILGTNLVALYVEVSGPEILMIRVLARAAETSCVAHAYKIINNMK